MNVRKLKQLTGLRVLTAILAIAGSLGFAADAVAQNTEPTATNLTQTKMYTEGDASVALDDIVVTDPDASESITATLTLADTNAGSLTTGGGGTYTPGTGVWTITDSVANVNTALAAVAFQPNTNYDIDTTIATDVQDGGENGSMPQTGTITLDVTPVNDQPTATNTGQVKAYTEGDASVAFDDIVVTDVDTGEQITATLTLNNTATGSLSTGGGGSYTPGTGVWTITDSVANVNTALAAVAFQPNTNNDVDTSVSILIADGGENGTAGIGGTITLNVTAVNDQPSATNTTQTRTYTEGASSVSINDIVVTDVDTGEQITATLTLADTSAGVLTTAGGGTYTVGTGVWTITDSVANVNTALASVSFTPNTNYDQDTTVAVNIADGGEDGATAVTGTITLDVTPVNDQPSATNTTQTVNWTEDDASVAITDIIVSDVDTGEQITATLTLSPTSAGSLSTGGGGSYTPGTGVWTITDTVANVNTALAAVAFVPASNYDQNASIAVNIADGGENGATAVTGTITLSVTAVNDQPSATNTTQNKGYAEGSASVALDDIVVSDVDAGEQITATLTLANTATGALSASGGATYTPGTGVWAITDSIANVNSALADVAFLPVSDNDVDTTIAVNIADGGEDGTTPVTGTITLDATGFNDQPAATNTTQTVMYEEGDASVDITDIVVTDPDSGEQITATLTLADTATGSLSTSGTAMYDGGTGIWTITDSVANVNAALAALTFIPATNNDQNTTVDVNIADGGENGSVAVTGTITLNVDAVNDPPVAPDFSVSTDEDTTLEIDLLAQISDVDTDLSPPWNQPPLDMNVSVQVTQGQKGSVNINVLDGKLIYTPFADEFGMDSFTYGVNDGDLSDTGVITVTIDPVNDLPFAQSDSAQLPPSDTMVEIDVLANDNDPDGNLDPATVEVVTGQEPAHGTTSVDPVTGAITYTLTDMFVGQDSFMYEVCDDGPGVLCAQALVTVIISPSAMEVDILDDEADNNIIGGDLSLREAIDFVADGGTITFDPNLFSGSSQTLALIDDPDLGTLLIDKDVTIIGPGADLLTVSGEGVIRVFDIARGAVQIEGMTIANGYVEDNSGAGINIAAGAALDLVNSVVATSEAADTDATINENGGGISSAGTLTITNSTIHGNSAANGGGGLYSSGILAVTNSTFSGNNATASDGGGILIGDGSAAITNVTLTGNMAVSGGGISNQESGTTVVANSLIAGNTVDGAGPDVFGIFASNGFNLLGSTDGGAGSFDADAEGVIASEVLDTALLFNGGSTPTHALLADSAAIDIASNADIPSGVLTDQRGAGFDRIGGTAVDAGAYEVHRFLVDTTADGNDVDMERIDQTPASLTLREALALAYPGDIVEFGVTGVITLDVAFGELVIMDHVGVFGPGADQLTISGGNLTQIFYVPSVDADFVLKDLTFANAFDDQRGGGVIYTFGATRISDAIFMNNSVDGFDGGAIHNRGNMQLTRCEFDTNEADFLGGAMINWGGTLVADACSFTNNMAGQSGGAFYNLLGGNATLRDTAVMDNEAASNGGGIYNSLNGTMTLRRTTVNNNQAGADGGGVANLGTLTAANVTLSSNMANRHGGGLYVGSNTATITNCTITLNLADGMANEVGEGGGIHRAGGTISLQNTIVAGNFDTVDNAGSGNIRADVSGSVTSLGNNLIGDGTGSSGFVNGTNGDLVGTGVARIDARLAPLADNGGFTQTHLLIVQSPAIDAGNDAAVLDPPFDGPDFTDQRSTGFDRIIDGNGDETAAVDIGAIEFLSTAPVFATTPAPTVDEDQEYVYNISVTDIDTDDLFAINIVPGPTVPAWLSLDDNGDGTAVLSGTPDNEDIGPPYDMRQVSVTVEVTDWAMKSTNQVVDITIQGVNDAPEPADDEAETEEDTPVDIAVLDNDSDDDGALDPASVIVTQAPLHGTTEIDPATGDITYTPAEHYNGSDSFVYEVSDNGTPLPALSTTATVSIEIAAVNDPPMTTNDVVTIDEDNPVVIPVLANDIDVDGNLDPTMLFVFDPPDNGTAEVDPATGDITFTPNENFNGQEVFQYRIFDDGSPTPALSSPATVTVNLNAINDPPSVEDDAATTAEDTPVTVAVLVNDSDVDGAIDANTLAIDVSPANGVATVDTATGSITYTPDADFNGTDTFDYIVADDGEPLPAETSTGTVTITVTSSNDAPDAVADEAFTAMDEAVLIDVLNNDSDVDGNILPESVQVVSDPANGSVQVDAASGAITYTPDPGFTGVDMFEYNVSDDGAPVPALSSNAMVTVVVQGPLGEPETFYVDALNANAGDGSPNNPFQTIAQAVEASEGLRGDTIFVAPGAYSERFQLKPDTTLLSTDGAHRTVILGAKAADEIVTLASGVIMRGFTVAGGEAGLGLPLDAIAVVSNCAFYALDEAVQLAQDAEIIFNNNVVYGSAVAGIAADTDARVISLRNNLFVGNEIALQVTGASVGNGGYNFFFANNADYAGANPFVSDRFEDPLFVDEATMNFHLTGSSPARDAGDPGAAYLDKDDSRNDSGMDGGPHGVLDTVIPYAAVTTTPSPAEGDPPLTVTLDASSSADEWGVEQFEWDFDALNGQQVDASGPVVQNTYTTDGTYIVTVTVTDANGLSATRKVPVRVGTPPEVTINASPRSGPAPLQVQFEAIANDPDGGPLTFAWDFQPDGIVDSTEQNPLYTYPSGTAAGGYTPTLTVTDDEGAVTQAFIAVTITDGTVEYELEVDPETGGVLNFIGGDLNGGSLVVPPGAVSEPIVLSISVVADPPGNAGYRIYIAVEVGPSGIKFSQPITLVLPVPAGTELDANLVVLYYNENEQMWLGDGISNVRRFQNSNGDFVAFTTTHLTVFAVVQRFGIDVNGDGVVNAVDLQLVINAVLGADIGQLSADVNNDGVDDALDVQLVINTILTGG